MIQFEIRNLIIEIRSLLERYGEKQWAQEFASLLESLDTAYATGSDNRKQEALDQIRRNFGGMGSFNDFRLSRTAGHRVPAAEQASANRELDRLSTQLYLLIQAEKERLSRSE